MAPIMAMVGNIIGGYMQSRSDREMAADQAKKALDFTTKANQVITKQVTNDPAYILKQYLANSGMPGFDQYLENIDADTANKIALSENSANSGGALLSMIAGLTGASNKQKNTLYTQSADYMAKAKGELADTRHAWQTAYDEIARQERARLNKAASQYQAADLNYADADRVDASTVQSTFQSAGAMANGMAGASSGFSGMGGGFGNGVNGMTSTGDMSKAANFNLNNPYTFNMGSGMGF